MSANNGEPLEVTTTLDGRPLEIQWAVPNTKLAVCGECGFEWDASHTVATDDGQVGYECSRCTLWALIEAREGVIKRTVEESVERLGQPLRDAVAELEHLRPQNKLLREDVVAYRERLVQHLVDSTDGGITWECSDCGASACVPAPSRLEHKRLCVLSRPAP